MKYYNMEKEVCKWPMGKMTLDSDFTPLIAKFPPKGTPHIDNWMKKNGDMLKIINQEAFFAEAMKKLLDELVQFGNESEDPNLAARLRLLGDFNNIRGKSLEDLANISTGLQLSMLMTKREGALEKAPQIKGKEVDSSVLRFASPLDQELRLFGGVLSDYNTLRANRVERQQLINLSMLASQTNKGSNKRAASGGPSQGNQANAKRPKTNFSSNYDVSAGSNQGNNSFRGNKSSNRGNNSGGATKNFIKTNAGQAKAGNKSVSFLFHFHFHFIYYSITMF